MDTNCTVESDTAVRGRRIPTKKTDNPWYKSWVILASGLFTTSLAGGFAGSWWQEPVNVNKLVIGIEKLVPIIDTLDTKVEQIKSGDRTDEVLLAIDKLDKKLDVAPDLIAEKIKIPECATDCPDNSTYPFYVPGNDCTIDIPTQVEPKPDTALRVICVNRYGPTRCMPSLDRSVIVTRGYIRECMLVNSNLNCKIEKRLR